MHPSMSPTGTAAWSTVVCVAGLAAAGVVGAVLHEPWVFPSLGPTLMVVAETPKEPSAAPRSILVGHLVGIVAGYLALVVTGLHDAGPVTQTGLTTARVVAACLSLGVTALVLQLIRCPHPPSGATTLIVSLGILKTDDQLLTMALAVVLVSVVAWALNLLLGRRGVLAGTVPAPD